MNSQQRKQKKTKRERRKLRIKERFVCIWNLINSARLYNLWVIGIRGSFRNPSLFVVKELQFDDTRRWGRKTLMKGTLSEVEEYLDRYKKMKAFL